MNNLKYKVARAKKPIDMNAKWGEDPWRERKLLELNHFMGDKPEHFAIVDETSHQHWLTWSPVIFERPNFHRPQDFGVLIFE